PLRAAFSNGTPGARAPARRIAQRRLRIYPLDRCTRRNPPSRLTGALPLLGDDPHGGFGSQSPRAGPRQNPPPGSISVHYRASPPQRLYLAPCRHRALSVVAAGADRNLGALWLGCLRKAYYRTASRRRRCRPPAICPHITATYVARP